MLRLEIHPATTVRNFSLCQKHLRIGSQPAEVRRCGRRRRSCSNGCARISAIVHCAGCTRRRSLPQRWNHETEKLYRSALKIDANNARAWLGMGRVDSALSRRAKAQEEFTRAHELDPADGDALYYWSVRQPYPENVNGLEKHLSEFRDDQEREHHEREYVAFIKALAGHKVWTMAHDVDQSDLKLTVVTRLQDGPRAYSLSVRLNDRANANVMLDTACVRFDHKPESCRKSRGPQTVRAFTGRCGQPRRCRRL